MKPNPNITTFDDLDLDSAWNSSPQLGENPAELTPPATPPPAEGGADPVVPPVDPANPPADPVVEDPANPPADPATDEDEILPLVVEVQRSLGIQLDGELEDSVDGLVSLTRQAAERMANDELESLFQAYPDLRDFMAHRINGGDATSFFTSYFPSDNLADVALEENAVDVQERILRRSLELLGHESEDIGAAIEEAKTNGLLFSQAKRAQRSLVKHQEQERSRVAAEQKAQQDAAEAAQRGYWESLQTTLNAKTEFRGILVPESEKKGLLAYLQNPVKDGETQFQLDMKSADAEVHLALASLMMKKFDLSNIIARKVSTAKAQDLRSRMLSNQTKLKAEADKRSLGDQVDVNSLSLVL